MTDVRRGDPAARRLVVFILLVATLVGALLIIAFERYRVPLQEWILSEPEEQARRIRLILLLLGTLLLVPTLALAVYLWSLGAKILRARELPPPGHRVVRDTPVVVGVAAVARARRLKVLALGCGIVCVLLGFLLWRLASVFSAHMA